MNRRARLRLRGLVSLSDSALASVPMAAGGAIGRELCDVPLGPADHGDGPAVAIDVVTGTSGVADEIVAPGALAPRDVRGLVGDAIAWTMASPGLVGDATAAPPTGEAVDAPAAMKRGRALRALRALRTARALRLAIALGIAPGTGVE